MEPSQTTCPTTVGAARLGRSDGKAVGPSDQDTAMHIAPKRLLVTLPTIALLLSGCGIPSTPPDNSNYEPGRNPQGSMFGDGGLLGGLFGQKHDNAANQGVGGGTLGVNAYLWRGALDTLSFMPLQSADPFGGVIITDWYSPPDSPNERFKATAYILGRELRADGVRVTIFRQVFQDGHWIDAAVSPVTVGDIENKVLARARQLRVQTASQ
jgi:Domain of unknown function (DUF3576)